jgi:hypothetical protein
MNSKKESEIGLMAPEALDVEVTRIVREKLHPSRMRSRCLPCWRWYNSFCEQGSGRRNSDTIQAGILANSPTGEFKKTES